MTTLPATTQPDELSLGQVGEWTVLARCWTTDLGDGRVSHTVRFVLEHQQGRSLVPWSATFVGRANTPGVIDVNGVKYWSIKAGMRVHGEMLLANLQRQLAGGGRRPVNL